MDSARTLLVALTFASYACVDIRKYPEVNPKGTCANGAMDGAETDIDCGGGTCEACSDNKSCNAASDCRGLECTANLCVPAQCNDGRKSGTETDTDCGGECAPCGTGKRCLSPNDCAFGNCGSGVCSYVQQELIASSVSQPLGRSAALTSTLVAVGATWSEGQPATASHVVVFQKSGSVWGRKAKLDFADVTSRPGAAVALTSTGLYVGSPGDAATAGRVDIWTNPISLIDNTPPTTQIIPLDSTSNDGFGKALGIATDTNDSVLLVGAPDRLEDTTVRGEAYVFSGTANEWQQSATLWTSGINTTHFGASVARSSSFWAVVGASGDLSQPGLVRVYLDNALTGINVTATVPQNGDAFGATVAAHGEQLVIGARGAAYVVTRLTNGVSSPVSLPLSPAATASGLVLSVAISQRWIAVSVPLARGQVETFARVGEQWVTGPILQSPNTNDGFGAGIALQGQQLVIGSPAASAIGQLSVFGR